MSKTRRIVFRANEAMERCREESIRHFSFNFKDPKERDSVGAYIDGVIARYGPVVEGYPSWHPLIEAPGEKESHMRTYPKFDGLDHEIYFRNAFLTAPYGNHERVIKSVAKLGNPHITAVRVRDVKLYHPDATPVLVVCDGIPLEPDGTISKRYALGRMLSMEVPSWTWAQCGESWKDMRPHFLGLPFGSRSSLFINQETGQAMHDVWKLLLGHGLFGPARE